MDPRNPSQSFDIRHNDARRRAVERPLWITTWVGIAALVGFGLFFAWIGLRGATWPFIGAGGTMAVGGAYFAVETIRRFRSSPSFLLVDDDGFRLIGRGGAETPYDWRDSKLRFRLRDGRLMPKGIGSYLSVPCLLEVGGLEVGISAEAFEAVRLRAAARQIPSFDYPSPFGRILFFGPWGKTVDRLRHEFLPERATPTERSDTVPSPFRWGPRIVSMALIVLLSAFLVVTLALHAGLGGTLDFDVGSLIFVVAVAALQEMLELRGVTVSDEGVKFRYLGRSTLVPWSSLSVPPTVPYEGRFYFAGQRGAGSGRLRLRPVALVQARAILDHRSCPRFDISEAQRRALGYPAADSS